MHWEKCIKKWKRKIRNCNKLMSLKNYFSPEKFQVPFCSTNFLQFWINLNKLNFCCRQWPSLASPLTQSSTRASSTHTWQEFYLQPSSKQCLIQSHFAINKETKPWASGSWICYLAPALDVAQGQQMCETPQPGSASLRASSAKQRLEK